MKPTSDNMSSTNSGEATDMEYRSGPITEPQSLKTLSYLAYVKHIGYNGPYLAQTCNCGCTINGIHHPSAENLMTLDRRHHDGTTCHMGLWRGVQRCWQGNFK